MKSSHHTTSHEVGPSLQEIGRWPLALIRLHQRLAPYFARPEPRQHALLYLQAIGSLIPRKNSWQIAEHAKQARPYGMQRLLSRAIWDEEGVRDELRTFILHCLSPPSLLQSGEQSPDVSQAPFPVLVMKAYYLVFAPPGTSLHTMVLAIGAHWSIEVDLENAKDLGLDQYEVRSYAD